MGERISLRLREALTAAVIAGYGAAACGAHRAARPDPAPLAAASDASAGHAAAGEGGRDCRVQRAARTYVGFSDEMSLDDFELAALEAERILLAIKTQLCEFSDAHDRDGSLRSALQTSAVEVTSIAFTEDDAGAADVRIRLLVTDIAPGEANDPAERPSWLLELVRGAGGWQVVSSATQ
jgi:hypothetical protein